MRPSTPLSAMHHTFQRTWIAALLASPLWALAQTPPPANALPTGGQVAAGQVQIQQNGAQMTIQQGSARAAIDWQSFNVGREAHVQFQQPSAQSVTLNRVQGPDASQIFGRISANGQVFLSNPNGVYFAPGASVDVGGLVATTHRIGLDDFMAGRTRFERQGATGSVVNAGELKAALGGYIALLAPAVRNQGVIVANLGTVALAAGEAFELQFDANNTLAGLRVEGATIRALVDNRSAVLAPGGLVILSAQALDRVQGGVIRNSGRIEATGLAQRGGRIVLEASSQIANSGRIDASATAHGPAGSVRLQAPEVVNSGTIAATGSAAHPQGGQIEIVAGSVTQTATGVVDASAPVQGGGVQVRASGAVELAGRVSVQATLDLPAATPAPAPVAAAAPTPQPAAAPAPTQGGEITIQAAQITLPSATLDASGGRGGRIVLDASAPARSVPSAPPAPQPAPEPGKAALLGTTQLSTRGRRAGGGAVTLLGNDITLKDHTALDATGATAGGTVRVGGGWQGGEGLYQATTVAMDSGAAIDASATQQGDGGTVVLWSDARRAGTATTAHGSILARGGALGGDGGQVETSGHQLFTEGAFVDTRAAQGRTGMWLLDPNAYVIAASGGNRTGASIAADLNTSNVTIQTTATAVGDQGYITINDTIAYTGASARTLTFKAHNDITLNSGRSITSSAAALNVVLRARFYTAAAPDNGAVAINGNISTNGGGLWIGGGSGDVSWTPYAGAAAITVANSVAASWTAGISGVSVNGATISTGAGNISIGGQEFVTGPGYTAGVVSRGVLVRNSSITTTSGNIDIVGTVRGAFDNGLGVYLQANGGNTTLQTGAGTITITGTGSDDNTSGSGWRHAVVLGSDTAGHGLTVRSTSGAIALNGTATFTDAKTNDTAGLQFQAGTTTSTIQVVSQSGDISLKGSNSQEAGVNENAIRFAVSNAANLLRIGYDGSTAYSGNILVEGNSLQQLNQNAGSGSIAMQTSGGLTFQSAGNAFTQLRAGAGALSFDNDWNFGTTLSSFTLGKATNTADLTLSNALSVAGAIHITGGQLALNAAITSTGTGDIQLIGNAATNAGIVANGSGSISKTGGGDSTLTVRSNGRINLGGAITNTSTGGVLNVVLWSDYGNATSFGVSSVPAITTRGGHLWVGGSNSANGSTVWNGLTVGDGAAAGGASGNNNAIDMRGALDTSNGAAGGDVYLWGGTPHTGAVSIGSDASFTGISAGSGNITLRGNTFQWPAAVNIATTGGFTLWSASGAIGTDTGSFAQATDLNFFKFNAAPSALTWGGSANTQNVTFSPTQNATLTVAGPITVHGNTVNLDNNLATTGVNPGDSLISARNDLRVAGSFAKTGGSDSTLTMRAYRDINFVAGSGISASGGKLNVVLASDWDAADAGAIYLNGSATPISLATNGGHLWIGGNGYGTAFGTTTWNGLSVGTGLSNSNGLSGIYEGVNLNRTTVNTGGGNLFIAGRNDRYNSGEARLGVVLQNSSNLTTGAGSISIQGTLQARNGALGVLPSLYGVHIDQSSLSSTTGAISITGGEVATDNNGNFTGFGVRLFNASVSSTAGDIAITGTVGTNNASGESRDGIQLRAAGDNARTTISSTSGNITLTGTSYATNTATGNGISMTTSKPANTDVNHAIIKVVSQTGNVLLVGDSPHNTNTGSSGIAFNGQNYGRFYIGQDESGTHSGSLTLTGRSVTQTNMAVGYLRLQGSGALTIQPLAATFVRGGTRHDMDFDGYWNFGSSHSALTLGKEGNNSNITISNALTANGPVRIHGRALAVNADITSTGAGGEILLKSSDNIVLADGRALQTNGGDITLWADRDADGGYIQLVNNNRLDSRTAAARTANGEASNGTTATGGGRITLAGGNGASAADGYARSNGAAQLGGVNLGDQGHVNNATTLYSGGGDVVIRGQQTGNTAMGVQWINGGTLNAGRGKVRIDGLNTGDGHGMELGAFRQGGQVLVLAGGGDATTAGIDLVGTGAGTGTGVQVAVAKLYSTGAGGIRVAGTAGASGTWGILTGDPFDVLAASGAITLDGGTAGIRMAGSIGAFASAPVPTSSSNVTLTGDRVEFGAAAAVRTTGTLTVQPFGTSFSSAFTWPLANLTLAPTVSGLTLGKAGNIADITVASATSIAGPIRIYGGDIVLNGNLTTTLAGAGILLKASGNIASNAGRAFQTNNGDITFWSDSDASGAGNIIVGSGNTLNTANGATGQISGGGRITLAGGLDDGGGTVTTGRTAGDERPDGYAVAATTATSFDTGAGVSIGAGSNLHSGGGDVFVAGQGTTSTAATVQTSGIWFWSGLVDAGAGKLALYGRNVATNNTRNQSSFGIHLNTGSGDNTTTTLVSASGAADAITLVGDSSASTTTGSSGLLAFFSNTGGTVGTRIAATNGGGITLTGKGSTGPNATGTGALGDGIDLNFAQVLSTGGPITLNGTGGPYGLSLGGRSRANNFVTLGRAAGVNVNSQSMAASSSDVVLNADALLLNGGASSGWVGTVATSGSLAVQPIGTSFSSPLVLSTSLTLGGGLGGLTLGKAGNTADITLARTLAVNGPVTVYGGNLALNAGLTAGTVTLQASGTVSDGPSSFVSAASLLLLGGDVVLDGAGISVGTLAASGVGSLEVRNSGALTIGSVGATSGISASGTVSVSTEADDLTVAGPITTSNTGTNAIVLNAGRAAAAGTAAGGNVVASGSPLLSTGAGGRATLYSGSVAGSTGLAALVGSGTARYRYHSDESTSNFSTALGSGSYAIYREQPTVALRWDDQSVVYGTALSAFTYTLTSGTLQGGEAPTATISGGVFSGAGHLAVSATPYAVADSGALQALGYSVSATAGAVTVTPRTLTASYSGATRAYDGSLAVNVSTSGDDRLGGDVISVSGSGSFADANAGTGKAITISGGSLSGADAGNYVLAAGGSATGDITRRTVSVGGAVVANKVYDGTTDATLLQPGQVLTGVGSETLVLTATGADFDTAGAGTGKTVTVSGYALANGSNGGLASNYALAATTATTTADVAKAVLTVVANNDAKFITQADNLAYNGVVYTGFVNGETAAVLGGAPSISRSNAGTEAAGIYNGVLVADTTGLTAANYSFQTVNGNYTIVPSNQLLVRVANTTGTYGAATAHSVTSAQYFDGSTVIDLPGISANGGNSFTISDGVGGTATLTVAATGAPVSTGGWTGVGAWQLGGSNTSTQNAANFSNTITVVGSETVGARSLAVNTAGGIAKVYDGTTAMPSVALQLTGTAAGDVLGVSAQGNFASRNAGSNIAYTVNGITLSGADAANYYVSGGSSFSGSNGSITPRTLNVGYTGGTKVYDGNTGASVTSSDDRIAGDALSVTASAAFADKNVGSGKLVAVSGAALSGSDAGNYTLASTTGSTTADITRLDSVVWVGGATGNWFDPANWAGGAVPDLANVANVVIPAGVVVSFDTTGVIAPAQTGPVLIDSLGGAGGGLVQNDGVLNVGGGGILLAGLTQHGGSLTSDGGIVVNDFSQTGGSTSTLGNLTVNGNFAQGPNGAVTVGGDANITDTTGGTSIGNLHAGGDLAITSTDGSVTQQPGTVIVVDGRTTVNAGTHDITLDGPNNNFVGPFNASGGTITVVDGVGGLVIGHIDAGGSFDATSTGGDITQQPGTVIAVDGTTTVDAGTHDIRLDGPGNNFVGPFNASGKDVTVVDGLGGLVIGHIAAGGNFGATSTGGDITQAPGSVIRVEGQTVVDAGTDNIVLDGRGNDFQGPFNGRGNNIQVVDGVGGLVMGDIAASGNFGATSTGGRITQAQGSAIVVAGTTTVDAGAHDIVLDGPNNDFLGPFNGTGRDIAVVDGHGGLVIGNIDAAGSFVATSAGGGITQVAGSVIAVDGDATLSAPGRTIVLAPSGNQFGGRVDLNGAGGEQAPVVVPPAVPVLRLPVPETAPQAIDASGAPTLMAGATIAMAPGDGVVVRLATAASAQSPGLVTVDVPRQMAATGFSFTLPQALTADLPAGTPITATLEDGSALPAWLQFDAERRRFTASTVPSGGLPLRVLLRLGGRSVIVEIASANGG